MDLLSDHLRRHHHRCRRHRRKNPSRNWPIINLRANPRAPIPNQTPRMSSPVHLCHTIKSPPPYIPIPSHVKYQTLGIYSPCSPWPSIPATTSSFPSTSSPSSSPSPSSPSLSTSLSTTTTNTTTPITVKGLSNSPLSPSPPSPSSTSSASSAAGVVATSSWGSLPVLTTNGKPPKEGTVIRASIRFILVENLSEHRHGITLIKGLFLGRRGAGRTFRMRGGGDGDEGGEEEERGQVGPPTALGGEEGGDM